MEGMKCVSLRCFKCNRITAMQSRGEFLEGRTAQPGQHKEPMMPPVWTVRRREWYTKTSWYFGPFSNQSLPTPPPPQSKRRSVVRLAAEWGALDQREGLKYKWMLWDALPSLQQRQETRSINFLFNLIHHYIIIITRAGNHQKVPWYDIITLLESQNDITVILQYVKYSDMIYLTIFSPLSKASHYPKVKPCHYHLFNLIR